MEVSKNRGFSPQIIHFNKVFHYKPSIVGKPTIFGNHHIVKNHVPGDSSRDLFGMVKSSDPFKGLHK